MRNRSLDPSRLAALASRPGIDPRIWLCEAVIVDLGFDSTEGAFADVRLLPEDTPECARVGLPYAGNGFGAWWPLEVDDVVLLAIPMGNANNGPVIISRMWSATDQPPGDCAGAPVEGGTAPTEDAVLRVKPGHALKIRTSGAVGGAVSVDVEGDGTLDLVARGSGKITIRQKGSADIEIIPDTGVVKLGGTDLTALLDGVVTGRGVDTFTGSTYGTLGSASSKVMAKK